MIRRPARTVAAGLLAVAVVSIVIGAAPSAGADDTTLAGEGGTFLQPVITKLLADGTPTFDGLFVSYVATGLDPGIADFVGTGPGQFPADFAVSERPLTAAEQQKATADGRSYAYVPFAATPVAVATLVPTTSYSGGLTISPAQLCPHIELTVPELGAIYGIDSADPVETWADPRLACSTGAALGSRGIQLAANDDPTMANYALMALLDSDPTAKSYFAAGLQSAYATHSATTSDTAPSETWPYTGAYDTAGGDDAFIGKLLTIDAKSNTPSDLAGQWALGATFPVSSVWTGAPLGAAWNVPTAAVQNAQGSFVAPSEQSAAAAEADATVASTSDPTTDNLVTFQPSATAAAAYNSYLMEESYLVVPTGGLSAAKDTTLADLIRFILGPDGQRDIERFGAAPATAAMDAAGLKVAAQLDALAAQTGAAGTSTTTSSPTGGSGTGTLTGEPAGSAGSGGSGGSSGGGSGALAFTGSPDLVPLVGTGAGLFVGGALWRRRLRRRGGTPVQRPDGAASSWAP